ncbi:MAG: sensor histidine kinase [Gemmatimonadota bacterium]
MTAPELLAAVLAALALGAGAGAWLARRGWLRRVAELDAYLEGWFDAKRDEDDECLRRARGPRSPLRGVYGKLDESRRTFLDLRSVSELTARQLQRLMDVVSDEVLVYDGTGRLLFASREIRVLAARAAGRSAPEPDPDAVAAEEVAAFVVRQPELHEAVQRGLGGGEDERRTVTLRVGNEELSFVACVNRVPTAEVAPPGLLVLLTPLELLRELRRSSERRVALQHLELAAELLAHRLRNPLNSIVLLVEVLRRERAKSGAGFPEDHLEAIQAEVAKLEATLERYLELVRRRDRRPEAVDLVGVVETVCELLYPLAREVGLQLRQEVQVRAAIVRADRLEVTRALLGPALAAVRAGGAGDALKVRLDSDRREHLLYVEAAALPAGVAELGVAEDLATRNGGRVALESGPPARLTYRYPVEA